MVPNFREVGLACRAVDKESQQFYYGYLIFLPFAGL
jgi:hypothetical protein